MTREEQEQIKLENQNKRIDETVLLCTEFLLTNLSDIELSNKTGISSSTVGRRLTNQSFIYSSFPKVKENLLKSGLKEEQIPKSSEELFELIQTKRQENLLKGKALGGQTTLLNHIYLKGPDTLFQGSTKLSLNAIYSTTLEQYKFIINASLYFRLHLDTLSKLFQIEEKELLDNMLRYGNRCYESLKTLFYHDSKDQNIARIEFMNYYREMLDAIRHKNLNEKSRLTNIISDKNASLLLTKIKMAKEKKLSISLSNEDIETLIKYQLKYYITTRDVAYMFLIDRNNYQRRVTNYLEENLELKKEYESLMAYNEYKYKKGNGRYHG